MKVTTDKIENSQAYLTVEVDQAEVEASKEQAYHRLVQKANVPGFRKGKAPRAVLERHIGKDRLFEGALDILIPDVYEKAIKEQKIEPVAQPQIEVTQAEPLVFKAIVPLKPTVTLGDYRNIAIAEENPAEITETQIDAVINEMRHRNANWESIELRTADYGDLVVIDLEGKIGDKPFSEQKNVPYQLNKDNPVPVPGFAAQLNGMKKGESKEFTLPIPADYPVAELVGKDALFKVKVRDVSQEILPALDDNFAHEVDNKFNTLQELRQSVIDDIKKGVEQRAGQKFEDKIIDKLVEISKIEFPPIMVESEINRIINQRFPRGREEMEAYLQRINKTPEAFHAGLHPFAETQVKTGLALGKVAEEEKIEATDADVDAEIKRVVATVSEAEKDETFNILNAPENRVTIKHRIITQRTLDKLIEMVRANAGKVPAEAQPAESRSESAAPEKEKKTTRRKAKTEDKQEEEKKS